VMVNAAAAFDPKPEPSAAPASRETPPA
jgi:hypothetical protein